MFSLITFHLIDLFDESPRPRARPHRFGPRLMLPRNSWRPKRSPFQARHTGPGRLGAGEIDLPAPLKALSKHYLSHPKPHINLRPLQRPERRPFGPFVASTEDDELDTWLFSSRLLSLSLAFQRFQRRAPPLARASRASFHSLKALTLRSRLAGKPG